LPAGGEAGLALPGIPSRQGPRVPSDALLEGERKQVTVLFADLCGYTALSEHLDPEEVKDILIQVFGEIAGIVQRYEGFIEKYVGDAAMAIFGASRAYEDDPLRAVRAAREIHQMVARLNPLHEARIGRPLAMHTGINTGLVILGHLDADHGTHGISGDSVNIAARLCELGREGDILVGPDTFLHCQGGFRFEALEPVQVKGKSAPMAAYRLLESRDQPRKVHRAFGRQGVMVGREPEMRCLLDAAARVRKGTGAVVCIAGAAGTGKSRLLEEFRAAIASEPLAWYEGHAYPYARNTPYAPLIDLLSLACRIEEGDLPQVVRQKIEHRLGTRLVSTTDHLPYIGSLFGLHYPELNGISPEYWRSRLKQAVGDLLDGLARIGPMVVCIEDLHWADPSSVDLLRSIALKKTLPLLLVCTYRKVFSFCPDDMQAAQPPHFMEIELKDLSADQTLEMVQAILEIPSIPQDLSRFVMEKTEGNPFYIEEMINTLIDRQLLLKENAGWVMRGSLDATDISSTIHGVVSGRLDHLQPDTKRVLQEASVIGRVFDYVILQQISAAGPHLDAALEALQTLDMIRKKDDVHEVKYAFKHAIVQEVVYNGILIRDRRAIHERIAAAMEQLFHPRLSGFYETLALHYSIGQSVYKGIDYLMKSGQKSKQRYAVDEAHQYYQRAYELLQDHPDHSAERTVLLANILIQWFFVFNVRGIFNEMIDLLKRHEKEAALLDNPFLQGMYCCCLGWALQRRESLRESYDYLIKAMRISEESDNREVQAYACGCLVWTCTDMGQLDEALAYGRRAEALLPYLETDQELIRIILTGSGIARWFRGEADKCQQIGEMLLAHGEKGADLRSTSDGYLVCGMGRFAAGDFNQCIEYCNMAIASSAELVHSFNSKFLLAYAYLSNEQVDEADRILAEIVHFTETHGYEYIGTAAYALGGMVMLARGRLNTGFRTIQERMDHFRRQGKRYHCMTFQYVLGRVYLHLALRKGPLKPAVIARNLVFLLHRMPMAARKAEWHLSQAAALAESMGAMGMAGQVLLDMAQLKAARRQKAPARQAADRAVAFFQRCHADVYLEKAQTFIAAQQLAG